MPISTVFLLVAEVLVAVPEFTVIEQIYPNTRTTIALGVAASIAVTVLVIVTYQWIIKPIARLNAAAKTIAKGEWNKTVDLNRSDALGELAKVFNNMAEQLQASLAILEAKNAEMKALNDALAESEHRLAQFFDALPVGVFIVDADGKPYYTNQTGKQILGTGVVESATLEQLRETCHIYLEGREQLYPKQCEPILQALQGESVRVDDMEIRRADRIISIESVGTPIYDESGNIVYAIATFQDITQRRQAENLIAQYSHTLELQAQERTQALEQESAEHRRTEEALRQSEAQNRAILSAIPDLLFRVSAEGIYLGYVSTSELIDLLPPDFQPIGQHISEFLPPEVSQRHLYHLQQVLTTGRSQVYEQQNFIHGKLQYEEVRVVASGENEVLFMVRDISDGYRQAEQRKLAEQALRQKNEELIATLQQLQATQQELIQSEKMAALGQLIAGIAHEINTPLGAIQASIGNMTVALDSSIHQLPQLFQQLSPQQQVDFLALLDATQQNFELLSFREERQCKRRLKEELERQGIEDAQTVAATLVQMGITQTITPFISLLQSSNHRSLLETAYNLSLQKTNSRNIQIAIDRAAKIVFALKSYARQDYSGQMVKAQVTQGIDVVLTLYYNQLKQGIETIKNYEDVPAILCYPEELNQVWTNLIHNSIQAMNHKGRLELAVFEQERHIVVQVTDSGCGIAPDIKPRIFEPFFTTKPAGEGSGLGLDIVKKIIDKHQGKIEVESEPGRTTFSVWLPIKSS
jgi:PAS domain S-box-containing protein